MCRGVNEEETRSDEGGGGGACRSLCTRSTVPINCELCGRTASVFCEADSAFLCIKCDRWVHGANFIAWRHVRRVLCTVCQKLTRRYLIGDEFRVILPVTETAMETNDEDSNSNHKIPFVFL